MSRFLWIVRMTLIIAIIILPRLILSADTQSDEINTIAQFMLDRANDNLLYMMQSKMKENPLFRFYFPLTYEMIDNYKIKTISFNYTAWEKSITSDIDNIKPLNDTPNGLDSFMDVITNLENINEIKENSILFNYLNDISNSVIWIKESTITDLIDKSYKISDMISSISNSADLLTTYNQANTINISIGSITYNNISYEFKHYIKLLNVIYNEIVLAKNDQKSYSIKIITSFLIIDAFNPFINKTDPRSFNQLLELQPIHLTANYISNAGTLISSNSTITNWGNLLFISSFVQYVKDNKNRDLIVKYSPDNYNNFKNYATFFSMIVDIENGDTNQLKNFLKIYTLPPVSFDMKRKNEFFFSISSYLGLNLQGNFNNCFNNFILYLTAPIGFELSAGNKKTEYSYGIFLGILDFGKAVNGIIYNKSDTNLTWLSIIYPSISLEWGLSKTPIALSMDIWPIIKGNQYYLSLTIGFDMPLVSIF